MNSDLSRRQLLLMSALAAAAFTPVAKALGAAGPSTTAVDVGEIGNYAEDGVYDQFASQGFFIIRMDGKIVAQSSLCTHKRGRLKPTQDGFTCPLHHSAFSFDGKVTRPPARADLARYALHTDEKNHLVVDLGKRIQRAQFNAPGAYVPAPAA